MKINILTFINLYNYGSVLQAYALNKYIRNLGLEANTIFYDLSNNVTPLIKVKLILLKAVYIFPITKRNRKFNKFIKERISLLDNGKKYKNQKELADKDWGRNDVFIVGSDQCWCDITRDEFFLNFAGNRKKIAYAVSMGDALMNEETRIKIQEKTKKFDCISVREQYHKEQFDNNVSLCIDPVFLISQHDWNVIASCSKKLNIPESYIFVYTIYGSKQINEFLNELRNKTRLPIVLVGGVRKKIDLTEIIFIRDVGVDEWLSLIRGATYVVTDSFHATSFSLIFEKNVFPFSKSNYSRIDNMLNYFGLDRLSIHPNEIPKVERKIDYDIVKHNMNLEEGIINYSKSWIKENICKI